MATVDQAALAVRAELAAREARAATARAAIATPEDLARVVQAVLPEMAVVEVREAKAATAHEAEQVETLLSVSRGVMTPRKFRQTIKEGVEGREVLAVQAEYRDPMVRPVVEVTVAACLVATRLVMETLVRLEVAAREDRGETPACQDRLERQAPSVGL